MGNERKAKSRSHKPSPAGDDSEMAFEFQDSDAAAKSAEPDLHVYGNSVVCDTDTRGFPTPRNRSKAEIVVDSSEGFIPLWSKGTILRWRFDDHSFGVFKRPGAAKDAVRGLMGEALLQWGSASPIKFAERDDAWDFEIIVRADDRCTINGCVLASAFFPDPGRNKLIIYPKMFQQSHKERVETIIHEIGHIFGLRHFFADVDEEEWPSEIFGEHSRFSIMNYGADSRLTKDDKKDLKRLYRAVWKGELTGINGTPIQQVKSFSKINAMG